MIKPLIEKTWYKNCPPEETINNIRKILYSVGIFLTEESGYYNGFFHSHVYISNKDLRQFNIATNGKGKTAAYALASAYSEMMERLQNGYKFYGTRYASPLFLKELSKNKKNNTYLKKIVESHANLKYIAYPDELHIPLRKYLLSSDNIFENKQSNYLLTHGDNSFLDKFDLCCIPYLNIFTGNFHLLPTDCYYSGSNGMCAGNTPPEALIQGFCELFERYALKQILLNQAIPPKIPLAYFEGTDIYNKIIKFEHIKVIVLDCSFKKSLPVIGTIIINTSNNTYCLEMAGASTATVALERCITEHYQNGNPTDEMPNLFEKNTYDKNERYRQFYKQSSGFGKFNVHRLLKEPAEYEFEGFHTIIGDSFEEELSYIIYNILIPNNCNCFIRDNSILGFPTFHIYIPEISNIYDNLNEDDLFITLKSIYLQQEIMHLKDLDYLSLENICDTVEDSFSKTRSAHIHINSHFLYNSYCRNNKEDIHLLLATIRLRNGNLSKAINNLEKFIDKINKTRDYNDIKYYNCVLDILKENNRDIHSIKEKLSVLYDISLIEEALFDINPENQLENYLLPTCFHCDDCPVAEHCCYPQAMSIVRKTQDATLVYNQEGLRAFINKIMEKAENPQKSRH